MSDKYYPMYEKIGVDIPAHDNLLKVLGEFYGNIYLSQENRPASTQYLDFLVSEVHGLRIQELQEAREKGRKVIGTFCVFVPEEIILAADAISVGLCAGAQFGEEHAEQVLPRNTCALIKSFMGFKLAKICPYFESCDLVVGETTCDGKKKAYEILGEHTNMMVMEVPQRKEKRDRALWREEINLFMQQVEELTGVKITAERMAKAIRTVNAKRRVLQRLNQLRSYSPSVISGRDTLLINQASFLDDPVRFTEMIGKICDELETRVAQGIGVAPAKTPRLMVTGCPMAVPNWKVPYLIETSGAVIVGEESCVGTRNTRDLVDESGATLDEMMDHLADRYMKIDCATFTPNNERVEHVLEMARDLKVDGVIQYGLQFCGPYTIEAFKLDKALEKAGIPSLKIETDYSMEDAEILKNRIDAFLGMVK
jgi:benzoyl-CoA reductase/2-hydroxyglutaryl-CoA dehydratase subunit BcrC/BadD/HgdB